MGSLYKPQKLIRNSQRKILQCNTELQTQEGQKPKVIHDLSIQETGGRRYIRGKKKKQTSIYLLSNIKLAKEQMCTIS